MKQLFSILTLCALTFGLKANAQYTENFSNTNVGAVPSGWTVSSNTDVASYSNGIEGCSVTNKGLETPGVGQSAPVRFILPAQTFSSASPNITVSFKIFVFDANLKCTSMKNLPCNTSVNIYLVPSTYNDANNDPTGANILASQVGYLIENENGVNQITFNNLTLPNGTSYRIFFGFKTADNGCSGNGTKFVFDDFSASSDVCPGNNCVPLAQDDYFDADIQGFSGTINGVLFGGNTVWNNSIDATTYKYHSLSTSPATNGGTDYDNNVPALSTMTYSLVSGPTILASYNCVGTPGAGSLTLNANGTFTYTRSNSCVYKVSFTYKVTDGSGNVSNIATATIKLPVPAGAPLPVTFKSFQAVRDGQNVRLNWETASELNNKGFEVQRKTTGDWTTVASVATKAEKGSSSSVLSYQVSDVNTEMGLSQYRVKQVDLDGGIKFTDIKTVKGYGQSAEVSVFPNPATGGRFSLLFGDNDAYNARVLDATGRTAQQVNNAKGSLSFSGLKPGLYVVVIENTQSAARTTQKIIVQ